MIKAADFWGYLKLKKVNFFSGVPCSILKPVLERGINDPDITYIPAVREDAALGVASGAYLAGSPSGIMLQNSGLGNIINAITSFNLIYKVPVLIFVTWRGFKGLDAPEHMIMGEKTVSLLREVGVPLRILSKSYKADIDWALKTMAKKSIPVALVLKQGIIE